MGELEATRRNAGPLSLDALPLFSFEPTPAAEPARDLLREQLAGVDPDALSPREAQALLYRLKKISDESPQ